MTQTRLQSFMESTANTMIGFVISFLGGFIIFPLFNMKVSASANFGITVCFTFLSIARGYVIRRWFNGMKDKK